MWSSLLPTELLLLPEKNVIFILLVFKIYEGNNRIRYTVNDSVCGDLLKKNGLLFDIPEISL